MGKVVGSLLIIIGRLMKYISFVFLIATLILFGPTNSLANGHSNKPMNEQIEISDAWARATFALAKTGAVYLNIKNTGKHDVTLSKVSVDASISAMTQIHHTIMKDDMMVMQELEDGITIAKEQTVSLAPGGFHIMLMGLTGPLNAGESLELTLFFSDESTLITQVLVKDVRGMKMPSSSNHE